MKLTEVDYSQDIILVDGKDEYHARYVGEGSYPESPYIVEIKVAEGVYTISLFDKFGNPPPSSNPTVLPYIAMRSVIKNRPQLTEIVPGKKYLTRDGRVAMTTFPTPEGHGVYYMIEGCNASYACYTDLEDMGRVSCGKKNGVDLVAEYQ